MLKVNSRCEFGDELDFDKILKKSYNYQLQSNSIEETPQPMLYHLHAILIHSGSLNAGHYFCFIRPEENNQWLKFNDTQVTPTQEHVAFATGQGGYNSRFEMVPPKKN